MNVLRLAFALALLIPGGIPAQSATPMECVVKLRIPRYPSLARQAQISGKVSVYLEVGADGRAKSSEIAASHPILEFELRRFVEEIWLLQSCGGEKLAFEFVFRIEGEPREHESLTTNYERPNRFVLTVSPPEPRTLIN